MKYRRQIQKYSHMVESYMACIFTDNKDLDMERFETVGVIRNQPEFVHKETGKYLDQRI